MNQADLIARITTVLRGIERVRGAFLGGSFGRGEADAFSDVDVFVVVTDAEDIPIVLTELADEVNQVAPILFSQVLPGGRTITSITTEWLRFDLTLLRAAEQADVARERVEPLFQRQPVAETPSSTPERHPGRSPETLLRIVNEFIRVLGLSVVVKGRDDVIVAETGTNLLRDLLIRIMLLENGRQPRRGALALQRSLMPFQMARLKALPALDATWTSVFGRTKAIAEEFLPRARRLADELGAAWPEEFERVTLAFVREKIGLKID